MKRRENLKKARRLYRRFNETEPSRVDKIKIKQHDTLVKIGDLTHIGYLAADGKNYIHRFRARNRPVLAVSDDGKALYIVGGKYLFTDRGIEDR